MAKAKPAPTAESVRGRIRVHVPMTDDWTLVFLTPNRAQRERLAALSGGIAKGAPETAFQRAYDACEEVLLECLVEWRETESGKPLAPPSDMRAALRESGTLWGVQGQDILTALFRVLGGLGGGASRGNAPASPGPGDPTGPDSGSVPDLS